VNPVTSVTGDPTLEPTTRAVMKADAVASLCAGAASVSGIHCIGRDLGESAAYAATIAYDRDALVTPRSERRDIEAGTRRRADMVLLDEVIGHSITSFDGLWT
jgi:hypothetical protein